MRRRTFLAAVPAAAIASSVLGRGAAAPGAGRGGAVDNERRLDVRAGDRPVGANFASRSAVFGANGAAGSAHPRATMAAIDILRKGGSAVDAAIAMNACLGLLEPTANGIGGDVYALIWDPRAGKVQGIAGCPAAARAG
ncbi:gamma-glutamyltransferase [Sphingomonas flavalba]|uniref:gamma-glutamyltransferase n=1 Tax=Sphingomonas flavalba TaxID=2559804 RepID=UPI0039DF2DF6